jgi:hypothetical protein
MTWTTPADVRAQVQRLWDKGLLAAGVIDGSGLFPRRLTLKAPTSADLAEHFEEVRAWIAELRCAAHCRVVMRDVRHRVIGSNSVPDEIWVDSLDDALLMIGKRPCAKALGALADETRHRQPALLPWLTRHALQVVELAEDWSRLLDVVGWMQAHTRPGIYLREVDLPGVHSKFIEGHRGVLAEMLDLALPTVAIDVGATGIGQFCRRYGFRDKPLRIRFRVLDTSLILLPAGTDQDVTLNAEAFNLLDAGVNQVFITENETNFLAFPGVAGGMVLFGAGYGFEMLANAAWVKQCSVHYWGDIDTHGFAILDQLRAHHSHVQSLLMDRATLMDHRTLWVSEPKPERRDLPRLTPDERALFDDLRDNRIGDHVRLEQERVRFGALESALARICASEDGAR